METQQGDDSLWRKAKGFSGLPLKAPSEPAVRLPSRKRPVGSRLTYREAHQTVGAPVLLPRGAYPGTGKHYEVVGVLENVSILAQMYQKCKKGDRLMNFDEQIGEWERPRVL